LARQFPAPSQVSAPEHSVAPSPQLVPASAEPQVPVEQLSQAPSQALLQHTPSAQKPLSQTASELQLSPSPN
jgi:hypothetical protein